MNGAFTFFIDFLRERVPKNEVRDSVFGCLPDFIPIDISEALLLEKGAEKYNFLTNGDICVPGVDEVTEFHDTLRAMNIVGFKDDEIQGIIRWHVF